MLNEVMLALRVTEMEYAPEICDLITAAEKDLKIAGVTIDGECEFDITITEDALTHERSIVVDDRCSVEDELVITAIKTYVRLHFGSPPDYDRLERSYDLQRRQLANATGYTDWEGDGT